MLAHKLREAMAQEVHTGEVLDGHVEVDGACFGGHIRPENHKADRVDRRLARHQTGTRRVVAAFRERLGRTLPFVAPTEAEGVQLAAETVDPRATMSADEASHWDDLHARWPMHRVNHSQSHSDHGKHTTWVEPFFARLRRLVSAQHHHVSPGTLHQHANHAAWLEDRRRRSNGALATGLAGNAMASPVSRTWQGCWQRGA